MTTNDKRMQEFYKRLIEKKPTELAEYLSLERLLNSLVLNQNLKILSYAILGAIVFYLLPFLGIKLMQLEPHIRVLSIFSIMRNLSVVALAWLFVKRLPNEKEALLDDSLKHRLLDLRKSHDLSDSRQILKDKRNDYLRNGTLPDDLTERQLVIVEVLAKKAAPHFILLFALCFLASLFKDPVNISQNQNLSIQALSFLSIIILLGLPLTFERYHFWLLGIDKSSELAKEIASHRKMNRR